MLLLLLLLLALPASPLPPFRVNANQSLLIIASTMRSLLPSPGKPIVITTDFPDSPPPFWRLMQDTSQNYSPLILLHMYAGTCPRLKMAEGHGTGKALLLMTIRQRNQEAVERCLEDVGVTARGVGTHPIVLWHRDHSADFVMQKDRLLPFVISLQLVGKVVRLLHRGENVGRFHVAFGLQGKARAILERWSQHAVHMNLHGISLKMVIKLVPNVLQVKMRDGRLEAVGGYIKSVLDAMSAYLNFSVEIIIGQDDMWGRKLENGSWNGLVGYLQRGEAAFTPFLTPLHLRLSVMDFTDPVNYIHLEMAMSPAPCYFPWDALFRPFSTILWLLLVLTCIFVALSFRCLYLPSSLVMRSLLEQPAWIPETAAAFVGIWLLSALVISSAYKGTLMARLVAPETVALPSSLQMIAASHYELGLNSPNGVTRDLIFNSDNPTLRSLKSKFREDLSGWPQCMNRARHEGFVCIDVSILSTNATKEHVDSNGKMLLQLVPDKSFLLSIAWGVKKRFPPTATMGRLLRRLYDVGLTSKWVLTERETIYRKYAKKVHAHQTVKSEECDSHKANPFPLSRRHLVGTFFLLIIGLSISTIALLWELLRN